MPSVSVTLPLRLARPDSSWASWASREPEPGIPDTARQISAAPNRRKMLALPAIMLKASRPRCRDTSPNSRGSRACVALGLRRCQEREGGARASKGMKQGDAQWDPLTGLGSTAGTASVEIATAILVGSARAGALEQTGQGAVISAPSPRPGRPSSEFSSGFCSDKGEWNRDTSCMTWIATFP